MKIVDGKPYIQQIKELIIEYTKWLGRNLSFQNLDDELKTLQRNTPLPRESFSWLWKAKMSLE